MEEFWSKVFPITSVTRENLVAAGIPKNVVETLTDDDMKEIASAMEDVYFDHGYWEDLELCTKRVLERKQEDAVGEASGDTHGLSGMEQDICSPQH